MFHINTEVFIMATHLKKRPSFPALLLLLLDVLILKGETPFATADAVMRYLSGVGGSYPPSDVEHLRCRRLYIESEQQEPTDIDGQPGASFPVDVQCLEGALRIIVPAEEAELSDTATKEE